MRAARFVVCHNPEAAMRDATVRANLVEHLTALLDGSDDWSQRDPQICLGFFAAELDRPHLQQR